MDDATLRELIDEAVARFTAQTHEAILALRRDLLGVRGEFASLRSNVDATAVAVQEQIGDVREEIRALVDRVITPRSS